MSHLLSRREWIRRTAFGAVGVGVSGWFRPITSAGASAPRRSCVLLWMGGGPSQIDTFDPKPGHTNGGPFRAVATAVAGVQVSEHLPLLAARMRDLAIVRSMTGKEGDHGRATEFAHTGFPSRGAEQYPAAGAVAAKELGLDADDLPGFVSVGPFRSVGPGAHSSGFLGPRYAPVVVGAGGPRADERRGVEDLATPPDVAPERNRARFELLREMQREYAAARPGAVVESHVTAYDRAAKLISPDAVQTLDLDREPPRVRDRYGRTPFGQGCLLARRLVERGVPFVEVALGGASGADWDTHANNFETVRRLSGELDASWSALLDDLRDRKLLDSTLVVWMGEFGRTPIVNGTGGRDHYPNAWTAVMAGGGVRGGQVIGRTSPGGEQVVEAPATIPDLLATTYRALGIDGEKRYESNTGRPVPLVDRGARVIPGLLG